jgi:hypothetical protein
MAATSGVQGILPQEHPPETPGSSRIFTRTTLFSAIFIISIKQNLFVVPHIRLTKYQLSEKTTLNELKITNAPSRY